MDRLYNVTVEYLGRKKQEKFPQSTICLGKDGEFLVMDSDGKNVRFIAINCKVAEIAAHVIIVHGFSARPHYITAYCVYANAEAHASATKEPIA